MFQQCTCCLPTPSLTHRSLTRAISPNLTERTTLPQVTLLGTPITTNMFTTPLKLTPVFHWLILFLFILNTSFKTGIKCYTVPLSLSLSLPLSSLSLSFPLPLSIPPSLSAVQSVHQTGVWMSALSDGGGIVGGLLILITFC